MERAGRYELLPGLEAGGESDWSAREIVYHLVDTPPGGNGLAGANASWPGKSTEYEIWSDRTNLTEAYGRLLDMPEVEKDIEAHFLS